MTDEEAKTLGEIALEADMLRRQYRDLEEKMKEQRAARKRMTGYMLAELAFIIILAFAAGIAAWRS